MKLALNPIYIARFHRGFPLSFATAWIAYQGGKAPRVLPFANGKHKGDLHVHDAIRCVACIVAAGIFLAVISLVVHFFRGRSAA